MKVMNRSQAQNLVHDNFVLDIHKQLINLPLFLWDKDPNTNSFHVIEPDRQAGRDLIICWGPSVIYRHGSSETTRFFSKDSEIRLNYLINIEVKTTSTMSLLLDRSAYSCREAYGAARVYDGGRYPFSVGIAACINDGALDCVLITLDGANYRRSPRPALFGVYYSEEELYTGLKNLIDNVHGLLESGLQDTKTVNNYLDSLEPFDPSNPAHIDYNKLSHYEERLSDFLPPDETTPPPTPPPPVSLDIIEDQLYKAILKKANEDERLKKNNLKFLDSLAPLLSEEYKEFKKGALSDELGFSLQIVDRTLDRISLIGVIQYEVIKKQNKKVGYKIKLDKGYL